MDSVDGLPGATCFLKHVLSTIAPSTCLKICLLHGDPYFHGVRSWRSRWPRLSKTKRKKEVLQYHLRFEVLREMHKVRSFQLVLCASVWGYFGEEPVRMLEEIIAEERARGGFDEFPCKPSAFYNPQQFYQGSHRSFPSF